MPKPYLLLIEDNQDDVYLTLRKLHRNGFGLQVKVVGTAEEALGYLQRAAHLPLALLVSYRLPGLSGVELIDQLRQLERTRHLKAVLLTASKDERDHVCGEECRTQADACLIKPLGYRDLSISLDSLRVMPPSQRTA